MINKNLTNLNWKNKLEDTDCLPGETLQDKTATWEKLHARLGEKPRRKRIVWYWAAACLLLAMLIPLMLVYKNQSNPVINNLVKNEITKPQLKETLPVKKDAVAVVQTTSPEKKSTIKNEPENRSNNTIADTANIVTVTTDNNQNTTNEIISSGPAEDSSVVMPVAITQPKKKLKVVHINELGDPFENFPDMARNANLQFFQIKIANQEVYTNPLFPLNKTYYTAKPKISSSN